MQINQLFPKMNVFLIGILIISSFLIGSLYTKVQYLERYGPTTTKVAGDQAAPQGNIRNQQLPQAPLPENNSPQKVSTDDDPVLGDRNAKLTLIEFSDYECPFCKRFYDGALIQIKKEYIDTGKVKLVYRDLPLSFHDPMATLEAIAANCAREQGDDSTYFKYHDEIFNRTKSNGNGLSKDELYTIALDLGLNASTFKSCLDSEKYKDEVSKDLADASTVGANGTPTFFLGKTTSDGIIEGKKIVGAQPFSAFKPAIDAALK